MSQELPDASEAGQVLLWENAVGSVPPMRMPDMASDVPPTFVSRAVPTPSLHFFFPWYVKWRRPSCNLFGARSTFPMVSCTSADAVLVGSNTELATSVTAGLAGMALGGWYATSDGLPPGEKLPQAFPQFTPF